MMSCRSVKTSTSKTEEIGAQNKTTEQTSTETQLRNIQTTQIERTDEHSTEVEIMPTNAQNPVVITDNNGKTTTIVGGIVKIKKSQKQTDKNLSISDKSKTGKQEQSQTSEQSETHKNQQTKSVEKTAPQASVFWRLWWLWLIIAVVVFLKIKNIIKL